VINVDISQKIKTNLPLILIIILAISLRLWKIFDLPITVDEAIHGLIAFEMIKTNTIALTIGTPYNGPMGIYIFLPSIYFFGKNTLALRIPSFILSLFSIILFYLWCKELYGSSIALVASFIFTIIPMNVRLSITARDIILMLFFMLFTIYLVNKYNKTKKLRFLLLITLFSGFGVISRLTFLFFLFSFILTSKFIYPKLGGIKLKTLLLLIIFFIIGILPMVIYNLTNNFITIRTILGSFPKTPYNINLLDVKTNILNGIIQFYRYFLVEDYLIGILFICSLIFFFIPQKTSKEKNIFIFSNFCLLFVLLSTLTLSEFRLADFILISPFYSIILAYALITIGMKLNLKIRYIMFSIFLLTVFLIYVLSYQNLVMQIKTKYGCNLAMPLISSYISNINYSKIITSTTGLKYLIAWHTNIDEVDMEVPGNKFLYLKATNETEDIAIKRLNEFMKFKDVLYIFTINEKCVGHIEINEIFLQTLKLYNKTINEEKIIYYDEEALFKIYKVT
jgi:4-amino-4-deoxy-L-arabinose transferase-like glycosyltransferase